MGYCTLASIKINIWHMKRTLFFCCFFISGFAALLYQIIWVRQLEIMVGSSTLAATAVISSFMGGLAIGAALAARFIPRLPSPVSAFALAQLTIGAFALAFPFLLSHAQPVINYFYNNNTGPYVLLVFSLGFILLLIPTSIMGSTFALMLKILNPEQSGGKEVAQIYAANTLGAAAGAVTTGFVLLGLYGLHITSLIGVFLNLFLALSMAVLQLSGKSDLLKQAAKETEVAADLPNIDTAGNWRFFFGNISVGICRYGIRNIDHQILHVFSAICL